MKFITTNFCILTFVSWAFPEKGQRLETFFVVLFSIIALIGLILLTKFII